ncbi:MAG: FGGY family carbohydrate kinase [Candidatus Neomarinimicrobiota bacterium]
MYLLGYDIGSSSIKAAVIDAESGQLATRASSPDTELDISAPKRGWAEQEPETWWEHVKLATAEMSGKLGETMQDIAAIGISYQMHGLVVVDKDHQALRPSIIWCDSRAVDIGEEAFRVLGPEYCLSHFLNSPGNFTASKLKWVKDNEPELFSEIDRFMLPGDYIAMKLTGFSSTTESGLSEGILWDYVEKGLAQPILDQYGIPSDLVPEVYPSFSIQGKLTRGPAAELGLKPGIPLSYRAGDQPNNALSVNVLKPGELAASAGTSGVVYGVSQSASYDQQSRVNTFIHVNHDQDNPSYGVLLCVNGTGSLNSWLKGMLEGGGGSELSYKTMNRLAADIPIGSEDLIILPYGNGAERTLNNRDIGASIHNLQLNTHTQGHILRAAQEGIAFALNYGVGIMREMGLEISTVRATRSGMFLSPLYAEIFANVTGAVLELYDTDGAEGAARGAGIGAGIFKDPTDAFSGFNPIEVHEPIRELQETYQEAYSKWYQVLKHFLPSI